MKVYLLETDVYENRSIAGVYDSPERAMAQAGGKWKRSTHTDYDGTQRVSWDNDLDWGSAASVYEHDLTTDGPLRPVDTAIVQVYRPRDGRWAYLPESEDSLQLARDAAKVMGAHRRRNVWREPEDTDIDRRIAALAGG